MPSSRATCFLIARSFPLLLLTHVAPTVALAQESSPDARASATEQKMTDEERFSMLISLMGMKVLVNGAFPMEPTGSRSGRLPTTLC